MDISSETILNKMEALIQQAKDCPSHHEQQAYVTAIKALCELLTERSPKSQTMAAPSEKMRDINPETVSPTVADKPMDIEDANGGSLLDF